MQVLNIISGMYDKNAVVKFNMSHVSNTRGNKYKLQLTHIHYNLRKHFFSNRIIEVWNSLPNDVVLAESTNIFENRHDKFWANQDFKYDWNADISGIGSRIVNIV